MKNKALLVVGIVLVGLSCAASDEDAEVDCSNVEHHLQLCDKEGNKVCVWNKRYCTSKSGCRLECSNDPRKTCNGIERGGICSRPGQWPASCLPVIHRAKPLICVPSPGSFANPEPVNPKSALDRFEDAIRTEDTEYGGWDLVFRAKAGNGHSVYDSWTTGANTQSDSKPESMELLCDDLNYRSSVVSSWETEDIEMVKFALYDECKELKHIIFDGTGSDNTNWFQASRVITSSWCDLTSNPADYNYFSIDGHSLPNHDRRFFINENYGGCPNDRGHVTVVDSETTAACLWDEQPSYPQFLYSKLSTVDFLETLTMGKACYLAVFIKRAEN